MKIQSTESYGGMLNQDELAQRYSYMDARITYGYTEEEVSFLMGRPPYYFSDYERMEGKTRLTQQDIEILACIFEGHRFAEICFAKDEFFAYHEKRLIRVKKEVRGNLLSYTLMHPWEIKKNKVKRQEPIRFQELIRKQSIGDEIKIKEEISYVLKRLLCRGFFCTAQLPYAIYAELVQLASRNRSIYPAALMEVLYAYLHRGELILRTTNGLMHYSH